MEQSLNSHGTKRRRGKWAKSLYKSVCVCFGFFTTDVGVRRFYRMGINLTASCKYQSHNWDWEGSKAGVEKVSLGLGPAVCRQRKQKSVPADKMQHVLF